MSMLYLGAVALVVVGVLVMVGALVAHLLTRGRR